MILYQDFSSHHDSSKNMATKGRDLFSLYIYRENFKNLVRNRMADFRITWQECSFDDPLLRLLSCHESSKNLAARRRGLYSLYTCMYIEKFENQYVRNHWVDFNITWQKCSLHYPLPRKVPLVTLFQDSV